MLLLPVVLVVTVLLLVLPVWPWSRGWGWVPVGMVGMILGTVLLFLVAALDRA